MRNSFFLIPAVLILTVPHSSAHSEATIEVKLKSTHITESQVLKAIRAFRESCHPLGNKYWQDLTEITAETFDEYAPYRLSKGWKATIHLSALIPDRPKLIPEAISGGSIMSGQTLHYHLGGGPSPGFFAGKDSAKWLCSMTSSLGSGADAFVPVPALGFLP